MSTIARYQPWNSPRLPGRHPQVSPSMLESGGVGPGLYSMGLFEVKVMGNSAEEEGSLVEEVTVTPTMDQENTLALSRGRVSEDKQTVLLEAAKLHVRDSTATNGTTRTALSSSKGSNQAAPVAAAASVPCVASVVNVNETRRSINDERLRKLLLVPGSYREIEDLLKSEVEEARLATDQTVTPLIAEIKEEDSEIKMLRKQLDQAQADLLRKDLEMARVRAGQPAATGLPVHRPPHGRRDVLPPGHESEPVSSTIWTRPVGNQGINYGGIHNNQAAYAGRLPEGTHHNYPMAYPIGQVQGQRVFSDPASNAMASMDSIFEEMHQPSRRRGDTAPLRNTSFSTRASLWNPQPQYAGPGGAKPIYIGATTTPYVHYPNQYAPRPIGTPLSATATEFSGPAGSGSHWNDNSNGTARPSYISPTEPLNYRMLLETRATCDWKYIVDKIICNNDQQASIFLQQKLKAATDDQKHDIIDAIIAQCYPLMINRFGNFLVQRCFEHGAPDQILGIAKSIRGNTLALSMDPFGCHVIQKAFDTVPESFKAVMVHELLRRIPETVIHRYACHVWQKLFELRWHDSPPQIMRCVNDALNGIWHEVAMGETGSLVVQNIFENCLEEDKRPCINEVLASIDMISRGQFGNWCIQHICEHGAPADRSRAVEHVLRNAESYSMDQYASKVVEKNLKIGGAEFLGRYLDQVCQGSSARPRIPLIDIASDQYGNYLVQWILTNSPTAQHREIVVNHIRKHMVSLRGSKFGSRVGILCSDPSVATRPGPGNQIMLPTRFISGRYAAGFR